MWLDVAILIVVILSMVIGYRNGMVYSLLHGAGWLVSLLAAFFTFPHVIKLLRGDDAYGGLRGRIVLGFAGNDASTGGSLGGIVPKPIADYVEGAARDLSLAISDSIAVVCYNLIVFLMLVFIYKLITVIIINLTSKRVRKGLIGNIDGLLGLLVGGLKGVLLVFILLALILPVSLFISESARTFMEDALFSSIYAKDLHNNNLLLLAIKDLFHF
ncbi:MAG: CvpA family protein [Clostridiales Family XIII bacterium]|jgi:uncharacterized membrane protein required for colicin V production|nr:CvpA family protein [Clostridiales Family XIII bacterium]